MKYLPLDIKQHSINQSINQSINWFHYDKLLCHLHLLRGSDTLRFGYCIWLGLDYGLNLVRLRVMFRGGKG